MDSTGGQVDSASVPAVWRGWLAAFVPLFVVGGTAFALYGSTAPPGLTAAHAGTDGGDLLAAALTGGVPHPTGYPTHQLLLRLAIAFNRENPAQAGNFLSAVCAACTAILLADLGRRLLASPGGAPWWHGWAGAVAALAWAAAPTVWAQATITEVYALNALLCVALLWLTWRAVEARHAGATATAWTAVAGLLAGAGLGNHLTLSMALAGVLVWLALERLRGARFAHRDRLAFAGGFAAGLLVYLYVPLMAAGNPPVNWGDPRTLARLWWLVTGRLYGSMVLGTPASEWPGRVVAWLRETAEQFGGPWGALLALLGLAVLQRRRFPFWAGTLTTFVLFSLHAITYGSQDSFTNLLPAWAVAALWLAAGLGWTIERVGAKIGAAGTALVVGTLIAALLLLPGVSLIRHRDSNDLSQEPAGENALITAFDEAEPGGVILTATDGPTFGAWYVIYGLRRRADLIPINLNLLAFDWYRRTLLSHHDALAGLDLSADPSAWLPRLAERRKIYGIEPLPSATRAVEASWGVLVRPLSVP